jgi:hypothetical protein
MVSVRNRLLLLLVIFSVAAAVFSTTARAGDTRTSYAYTGATSAVRIHKPTLGSTSGDPDVPQNGKATQTSIVWNGARGSGPTIVEWVKWAGRIWMVQYLGVK